MIEKQQSLPCIVCDKPLEAFPEYILQPNDAVMCRTTGNYGSTVFDPIFTGDTLHFNICDECLVAKSDSIRMTTGGYQPVRVTGIKMPSIWGSRKANITEPEKWTLGEQSELNPHNMHISEVMAHANDKDYSWNAGEDLGKWVNAAIAETLEHVFKTE